MSRNSKVIVIVCVSVVVLAGLGAGVIFFGKVGVKVQKEAKLTVTKAQVRSMETALKVYHTDHGAYPTGTGDEILETLQGASTRGENPMRIRYLDLPTTGRSRPLDVWKVPFHLAPVAPGTMPVFFSSGPNRVVDTGSTPSDDIYAGP